MENKNCKSDSEFINYLKPVYNGNTMGHLLNNAEKIYSDMCKVSGEELNDFELESIESIDENFITFKGEDIIGKPITAVIDIKSFD